jgi:hypothetical protein
VSLTSSSTGQLQELNLIATKTLPFFLQIMLSPFGDAHAQWRKSAERFSFNYQAAVG